MVSMNPRIVFVWSFACKLRANQVHWHGKCGLITQTNENIKPHELLDLIYTGRLLFSWMIVFHWEICDWLGEFCMVFGFVVKCYALYQVISISVIMT